jgi:hypothetical protein
MTRPESLEARVRRLEDCIAIRVLIARYGFSIDDRDMNAIGDCLCRDGLYVRPMACSTQMAGRQCWNSVPRPLRGARSGQSFH